MQVAHDVERHQKTCVCVFFKRYTTESAPKRQEIHSLFWVRHSEVGWPLKNPRPGLALERGGAFLGRKLVDPLSTVSEWGEGGLHITLKMFQICMVGQCTIKDSFCTNVTSGMERNLERTANLMRAICHTPKNYPQSLAVLSWSRSIPGKVLGGEKRGCRKAHGFDFQCVLYISMMGLESLELL